MGAENNNRMDWNEVIGFVRTRGWSVVLRGLLSLGVVVALVALYTAFAPRSDGYRQEIAIMLATSSGEASYPNDRIFSSTDLISSPVLNRVWQRYKLADRVKFEDFCRWFSLIGYDRERMMTDAEYQTKMSKRNIMVTELLKLQAEYEAKIAAQAANNRYVLSMRPSCAMSREEAVAILGAVPSAWFDETSVLNAPAMPALSGAEVITSYVKRLKDGNGRALELVDALRTYHREISETCNYIRYRLLLGRNVFVDGQDLGSYESRLELVRSELLRLKNRLLVNGDPTDLEGFVNSRLDDMACETMKVEEKARAVRQTIDLLKDTADREKETVPSGSAAAANGALTLQADASFFKDFTEMVRRDASHESVQKYADEMSQYAKELAEIRSRKLYYDQIAQYARATRTNSNDKATSEKMFAEVVAYATELQAIGAKVKAFRDQSLAIYRTSDQFFALPSPARYGKSFRFSPLRIALGLLALWALYNLACLVSAWNRDRKC